MMKPKNRKHTRVLIVLAEQPDNDKVLSLRGYNPTEDDMRKLVASMVRSIRKRHPGYANMKPKAIYDELHWYVYEVCTGHGGWPELRGYASEYMEYGVWHE